MRRLLVCVVLCLGILGGCAQNATESMDDRIEVLRQKAESLGAQELARFNAGDLLYKNVPELHSTIVPVANIERFFWLKTYRRYKEYDVVDVQQSPSLIAPITIVVSFEYDQFSTPYRSTDEFEDALARAKQDYNFELRLSDSFVRYYGCDANGDLVGETPQLPSRPDYFAEGYGGEADLDFLHP